MQEQKVSAWQVLLWAMLAVPVRALAAQTTMAELTSDEIMLGIIAIVTGLLMCFAGYKLLRVLLFLTGFYVGYWFCYAVMTNIPVDYPEDSEKWIIFGTSLGAGLIVGLIAVCLLPVGIFFLGALGGFFLATGILVLVPEEKPIHEPTNQWIFIGCMAFACGVIALFLQKVLMIICSSFVGSFLFFYGVDIFAQTGFYDAVENIMTGKPLGQLEDGTIGMLAGCAAMAVLGIIIQFASNRRNDHTKPENVYVRIN